MKNRRLFFSFLIAFSAVLSTNIVHADAGFDSVGDTNNFNAKGVPVMTLRNDRSAHFLGSVGVDGDVSFAGNANFSKPIYSASTITAPQVIATQFGSAFVANAHDAVYGSIDSQTGKFYQLIGTYHGWDPNSIYIGGYNATNISGGYANATSVTFGGYSSGSSGSPQGSPAALVDLVNHRLGVGTTTPQSTLDVNGEVKIGVTGVSCSSSNEGAQRYNQSLHAMEYCNGSAWTNMSSGLTMVPPRALLCSSSERDWTQLSLPEIPSSARYVLIGYWYVIDGPDGVGISLIRGRADASSSDYVITGGRCAAKQDSCGSGGQSYVPFNQANHSIDVAVDSYSWNGTYCLYIYGYSN